MTSQITEAMFEAAKTAYSHKLWYPLSVRLYAALEAALATGGEGILGWQTVPVSPTRDMLEAGAKGSGEDSESTAAGAYEAMLAVAPRAPIGENVGPGFLWRWDAADPQPYLSDTTGLDASPRLPTREEAAKAAKILLRCNGYDLDVWTDGVWPCDEATDGLRALTKIGGDQ